MTPYRLDYCRTSVPLERIAEGLGRRRRGRLCLFGPPGSGKTAFAHHLAGQLGAEIIERRASDLLGMYVGQTEAHIAAMFREATERGAVLLLDEADSFLGDRRGAHHGWEVTQVNELLKQMEAFEGVFICATNLMDRLDPAVLRRFDLKVEYRYLAPEQAWQLLQETAGGDGGAGARREALQARLARLDTLTPGDFAAVIRQVELLGEPLDPERLVAGLEAECAAKPEGRRRPIGF